MRILDQKIAAGNKILLSAAIFLPTRPRPRPAMTPPAHQGRTPAKFPFPLARGSVKL